MYEIVKVLLEKGIEEDTIHEVLDVIEENYEIVDEAHMSPKNIQRVLNRQEKRTKKANGAYKKACQNTDSATKDFESARSSLNSKIQNVDALQKEGEQKSGEYESSGSLNTDKQKNLISNHKSILNAVSQRTGARNAFSKAKNNLEKAEAAELIADKESSNANSRLRKLKHNINNHYSLKWNDPLATSRRLAK